jgi:anhydro-N-acetylmuramic acid kinase
MELKQIMVKDKRISIGIMSGTSLDGIDVCLTEIEGSGINTKVKLLDFITYEYNDSERKEILKLCNPKTSDVETICKMNIYLGRKFGQVAKDLMDKNNLKSSDVDFVSSHGQTIYHMPDYGATLQIGELAEIAAKTGCLTIGDYRPSDMAVGGQGAPLVPFVDYILFSDKNKGRIMINIGGISNLTVLKASGLEDEILAFDCGPGNMLIDRVVSILTDEKFTYDLDGNFAMKGKVNEELLNRLILEDKFVMQAPPKSTGREYYNEKMVRELIELKDEYELDFNDFIATITAYTYKAIAYNVNEFITKDTEINEVYVGGGGSRNKAILKGLQENLGLDVYDMEELNFSSDAKEAIAFAVLGNEFLNERFNNMKTATGADVNVIMGKLVYPPFY